MLRNIKTISVLVGAGASLLSPWFILAPQAGQPDAQLPIVVPHQPRPTRERLDGNVAEVLKVLKDAGVPVSDADRKTLDSASDLSDDEAIGKEQTILNKYALLSVGLNDEAWFNVIPASVDPKSRPLVQGRWATFLIKIDNASRVTSPLAVKSAQALSVVSDENQKSKDACVQQPHDWSQWFLMRMVGPPAIPASLSGKEVEYFVLQICSLDAGDRAAELTFYLGGGQVSQGHYGSTVLLFKVADQAAH
jgi:hypothetical protein